VAKSSATRGRGPTISSSITLFIDPHVLKGHLDTGHLPPDGDLPV
jgi:hypothetical protein